MDTRATFRRAVNVVGILMALGALGLIGGFLALLLQAYHGQPPSAQPILHARY
jgi:hypothetical protein